MFGPGDMYLAGKFPNLRRADEAKSNPVKIQVVTEKILRTDSIVIEIKYVRSQGNAKRGGSSVFGGLGFFNYGKSSHEKPDPSKANKVLGLHDLKDTFKVNLTVGCLGRCCLSGRNQSCR